MIFSDKEELDLLRKGSVIAFEKLYFRYSARLYNFLIKLSAGNTYMAEELVQRAFIKVWEMREKTDPEKSFISYLCTIAKNMLLNEYEHQTVQFVYREYIRLRMSEIDFNTDLEIEKKFLDELIDKLTDKLPPKRKEIFILSRRNGLSNKEIASKLKISESTIETQLSKALAFMKEELNTHYGAMFTIVFLIFCEN
ncbi:MAG: carQ 1 [Bacteroidetes bacterium]|jgi:RNA polymerase sigma-70 factor (ECF subfamily)|nr:carQ 1 [Bacteroidota bacterium]